MSPGRRLMSSTWSSNPPSSLEKLLALNKISTETFVNASELFVPYRGRGLFGGTMVAQSLLASLLHSNMPEKKWKPVSIHCHFLQAVQPTPQLQYKVTTLKPGKNYLTKEVNLHQNNKLVFKAIVTLQAYKLASRLSFEFKGTTKSSSQSSCCRGRHSTTGENVLSVGAYTKFHRRKMLRKRTL